jgi:hypothetical protein
MNSTRRSFICPVCGESVPGNSKSCPECGACEKTGWSADAASDGLDLPDDDFDYDSFVAREFGGKEKTSRKKQFWRFAAVVVFCVLAWIILHGAFL